MRRLEGVLSPGFRSVTWRTPGLENAGHSICLRYIDSGGTYMGRKTISINLDAMELVDLIRHAVQSLLNLIEPIFQSLHTMRVELQSLFAEIWKALRG